MGPFIILFYKKKNLPSYFLDILLTMVSLRIGKSAIGNSALLLTGFNGLTYYVTKDGNKTPLTGTSRDKIQAANIDYIPSRNLLPVPTLNSNKVISYRLEF